MTPAQARGLRSSILRWYRKNRRDLPWRRTRDPYAIWVSEIMLQQTRVDTVIPYYGRFLERFPTVRALARASEADVLAAWSGLGYYSRARSLRAAAQVVAREHAGRLPDDTETLRGLPGVGAYTAAAIASVAYGRPAAAVDGNVVRVLARIGGITGRRDAPALRGEATRIAEALAPGPDPGDWTQALMELGALVCVPRGPDCASCPAAGWCAAARSGDPDRYPEPASGNRRVPERRGLLLVVRREDRVLLVPDDTGTARYWTCPVLDLGRHATNPTSGTRARAMRHARSELQANALLRRHLVGARLLGPTGRFTHRTYSCASTFEVWLATGGRRASSSGSARWVPREAIASLPLRAPTLKAFEVLRM